MHIDTTLDQLHALANHVIRDCSDIDSADRWQADQARNTQEALEQLADRAGDHGMSQLQSAALDVYAYMSAFTEDHRPPSPQQRLQLQQLSRAISRELPQPSVSSALRSGHAAWPAGASRQNGAGQPPAASPHRHRIRR